MKDLILFENNAVPDVGDAGVNVNGNPMIGNDEWQLRIRGLAASYSRNYFKWDSSTDFYNIDRIDQTRGPNSILFGFGAPGGMVNTSTKQANLSKSADEVNFTAGSWHRARGTIDSNVVLAPDTLALRVNAVAESGKSWREYQFDRARRADLAMKWAINKNTSLRVEGEYGKVTDNIARPWLAIDESFLWRQGGRGTSAYAGAGGNWTPPTGATFLWGGTNHMVVGDDGAVRNWVTQAVANGTGIPKTNKYRAILGIGNGLSNDSQTPDDSPTDKVTWSSWADTPANNAIIPRTANTGGPDAIRDTKYKVFSAFFESKITDSLSYELAINHQSSDFRGYDPDGSRAQSFFGSSSEILGDASADLPGAGLNSWGGTVSANPNAGKLFLENNWTRRISNIKATDLRATVAYNFNTGDWGKHRAAGFLGYNDRKYNRIEECEAFTDISAWPYNSATAEADVNRLYRRHYFQEGNAADVHVQSWRIAIPGTRWVTTQLPEATDGKQTTGMAALQSFFLNDSLVTIVGVRQDSLKYTYNFPLIPTRNSTGVIVLDPSKQANQTFDPNTLTAGAVYHATKWLSFSGNVSSSRDLPDLRIHIIGSTIPPMPESKGMDVGVKLDLLEGKLYATVGYYKGNTKHTTDWGTMQTDVTDKNTYIINKLRTDNLITVAEYSSHLISANGFMVDRQTSGWEAGLVANPTPNWRVSANFSINHLVARNSMAEVKSWFDTNSAWWRAKAGAAGDGYLLGGGSWDTLGANIGWMHMFTDGVTTLDGHEARGQRKYGSNLYTKYTFDNGALKGFSIGGGGRYQSKNVLGMYDNTLDGKFNPTVFYGRALTLLDAYLGYTFKTEWAGKGSTMDLQLNISNLLNKRDDQIYTLAWWGVLNPDGKTLTRSPERIGLEEPRKYTLAATLHF